MRQRARFGLVSCAAVVTLVLAGCGSSAPAGATSHADADAAVTDAVFDLLTQTGSYHRRQHILTVAEESVVKRCMTAKGLQYPSTVPRLERLTDEERALRLDERRREGYGLFQAHSSKSPNDEPPSAVDRYVRRLTPAEQAGYLRALFGDDKARKAITLPGGEKVTFPGEGCVHKGHTRLFGDVVVWARVFYVPETLHNTIIESVTADPAHAEVMREWSDCMARRGHRHKTPEDAREDLRERYRVEGASKRLHAREIEIAVADGECAREVKIFATVLSLKRDNVKKLSGQEREALRELAKAWLDAVARAKKIVE